MTTIWVDWTSSLILVSLVRERAFLWVSKQVTQTVQFSATTCFHSSWPRRRMAISSTSL